MKIKNKTKRILLLGPFSGFGGVESYIRNFIKTFKKSNIEISLVSLSNEHSIKTINNCKIHLIKSSKLKIPDINYPIFRFIISLINSCCLRYLNILINSCKINKKVHEINPDLVHAYMTAPYYGFQALFLEKKFPVVLSVMGIVKIESKQWNGSIKKFIFRIMEKIALKKIKNLTVISLYCKKEVKKICNKDPRVIPCGVEDFYFQKQSKKINKKIILFVGGFYNRKGIIYLIRAFKDIKIRFPDTHLHLIGPIRDKNYFSFLKDYVIKNNIRDVYFKVNATKKELKKEYFDCLVFVLPSYEESFGIVLLEAMAAGKPLVVTNKGAMPDIVENNKNGLLVGYGDVNGLSEKISLLLENNHLRYRIIRNNKLKAKNFTWKKITEQIYKLYREILKV